MTSPVVKTAVVSVSLNDGFVTEPAIYTDWQKDRKHPHADESMDEPPKPFINKTLDKLLRKMK